MFEPKLGTERKVSFERDGLDASKACHISARAMCAAGCREWKRWARSGKTVDVLSAGAALNACRSNKRSAELSVCAIQRFVAKRRTQLLISFALSSRGSQH
jgi:hypothetical protein